MILGDTSAWIHFFRGNGAFADRVDLALEQDDVAWCGPVATDIRRGLASPRERARVLPLLEGCHLLTEPDDLWQEAGDLDYALRRKGATVKTLDLLIATYALSHGVELLTADADFDLMRTKGVPLRLLGKY